jgi:acetyl-CoA carboxylase biotin carboxyl carrier protein
MEDLTNEDVADILALLDSLPYDELDLQTARFRLTLRRTPYGWTQSGVSLAAPVSLEPVPTLEATGTMDHRAGYNRVDGPSSRLGAEADETGAIPGENEAAGDGSGSGGEGQGGTSPGDAGRDGTRRELVAVQAPLPGTFYRAPRPGAEPFVQVGSRVGADTVVGIVETMKLMNSVTAGVAGVVAEICVGNGEFAAHGATVVLVEADR